MKNFKKVCSKALLVMGCAFVFIASPKASKVVPIQGISSYLQSTKIIGEAEGFHLEVLPEDVDEVKQVADMLVNKPNMTKYFIPRIFVSADDVAIVLQRDPETGAYVNKVGNEYQFKICDGQNVVGLLKTKAWGDRDPYKVLFDTSYFIDEQYWKQGFATRAVQSFISSCIENKHPYQKLKFSFEIESNNTASLRVLSKVESQIPPNIKVEKKNFYKNFEACVISEYKDGQLKKTLEICVDGKDKDIETCGEGMTREMIKSLNGKKAMVSFNFVEDSWD